MWRLRWKDTQLCCGKIRQTAAILTTMAQHRIPTQAGDAEARVHLHQSKSDSRQRNRRHILPKRHLFHRVTMRQLTYPKSQVCHPAMYVSILLSPLLNLSIMVHMPRIACMIKISIQICWLMKEHTLVNTLSAAWQCSWHPFCRWQQPSERTWQWR